MSESFQNSLKNWTQDWKDAFSEAKSWPFQEAERVLKRVEKAGKPENQPVIFETGYGPSGLPHIGTFGEVARTTMVMTAFKCLSNRPTKLICFSDDMDGLRKVPDNVPNKEMLAENLGKPLTRVPDPFGTHDSFGAHNNARLQTFLDEFGFNYTFMSSTECYTSGRFNETLLKLLSRYDQVMNIMLPTLRAERRATYAPFLPICPRTGVVLQVPITQINTTDGTISYTDPETEQTQTIPVTDGKCKLQWKPDWAMRWAALGVDYEMAGKDLADSIKQSGRICKALDGTPPEGLVYELFLDAKGEKISKSKGNGLSIEEWLTYAPQESLALYMYKEPKRAKRLYFDVIPKCVDEYYTHLEKFPEQDAKTALSNPVFFIHTGHPEVTQLPVSFAMLLNLASVTNADRSDILWGFISNYQPKVQRDQHPELDKLVSFAIRYYNDFVKSGKNYRQADEQETKAFSALKNKLLLLGDAEQKDAETIQTRVYETGKEQGFENLKDWFQALYQILLGQDQGPRFGSFIAIYGIAETCALIDQALSGELSKI